MGRKILHIAHTKQTNIFRQTFLVWGILAAVAGVGCMRGETKVTVKAAAQSEQTEIIYDYDRLGRVSKATYPDGQCIIYTYDANGNLQEIKKATTETAEKPEGGGSKPTPEDTGDKTSIKPKTELQLPPMYGGRRPFSLNRVKNIVGDLRYMAEDVKNYNKFKKKLPKIKSIKYKDGRKTASLNIRIRQVNARGKYGETGYEIRYSENAKFKSSKKVTVSRRARGKYTSKSWNVKKGKTYYVKVRAYMKTVTGKTIYTKPSKVKKIKVFG